VYRWPLFPALAPGSPGRSALVLCCKNNNHALQSHGLQLQTVFNNELVDEKDLNVLQLSGSPFLAKLRKKKAKIINNK
jgi:hypothetical protein